MDEIKRCTKYNTVPTFSSDHTMTEEEAREFIKNCRNEPNKKGLSQHIGIMRLYAQCMGYLEATKKAQGLVQAVRFRLKHYPTHHMTKGEYITMKNELEKYEGER